MKHLYPGIRPGTTVDRLVSFVDMPKTWLSLAGAEIPNTFQGTVFWEMIQNLSPNIIWAFASERTSGSTLSDLCEQADIRITKLLPICPGRASPSLSLEGPIDTRLGAAPPGWQDKRDYRPLLRASRV